MKSDKRFKSSLNMILRSMMMFRIIIATSFLLIGFFVLDRGNYPFFALISAFYLFTTIYLLIVQARSFSGYLPHVQIVIDVVIVTCLIAVAESMGGIFLFLYLIPIISASLYFEMKQSAMVALGCGLMYCLIIATC